MFMYFDIATYFRMVRLANREENPTSHRHRRWRSAARSRPVNPPWLRPGQPEDIGKAAVYLASDDASFVPGKILRVGGGMWM